MDRWPYPFIQMNPDDMKDLGLSPGDLVEVYNDNGATQAMAYPTPTARRKQTFMLFAFPTGVQGNVVSPGVNELDHSELQTDLGRHSQDRLRARRRARDELQVLGVQGLTNATWTESARAIPSPEPATRSLPRTGLRT